MSRIHYPSLTPPEGRSQLYRGTITLKASTDVPLHLDATGPAAIEAARAVRLALYVVPHVSTVERSIPKDPRALAYDVTFEAGEGESREEDSKLAERALSALEDVAVAALEKNLALPDVEIEADHELDGLA